MSQSSQSSHKSSGSNPPNWRFRFIVGGGSALLAVLVGAAVFGWRMHALPRAGEHFTAAENARTAGRLAEAVIEYKNVLQIEPSNHRARWRLGQTYLALRQPAPALKELEHALPLAGLEPQIAVDLARARIRTRQFQRALAEIEALPAPLSPELEALAAEARLGLGQKAEAAKSLREATVREPGAASLHLATARLALSQNDLAAADASLAKALELAPEDPETRLLAGRVALLRGSSDIAVTHFERALALAPDRPEIMVGLGEALLTLNRPDDAEAALAKLVAIAPDAPQTRFLQGWLAAARGRWTEAETALADAVQGQPPNPQALLLHAESALRQDKLALAEARLRVFEAAYPKVAVARRMLGTVLLRQRRPEEAITVLEPFAEEDGGDPAIPALLSHAYYASGKPAKGAEYLARAQTLAPDSVALKQQQALGELAAGNAETGISQLEQLAAAAPGDTGPRELLTYARLWQGNGGSAVESARALVELRPEDPTAHNLLGIAEARAGNRDAARAAFESALARDGKFAPSLANLGLLALEAGDEAAARSSLEAALRADAGHTPASVALAQMADRAGRPQEATAILEAAARAAPRAAQPRWLLALRSLGAGDHEKAVRLAGEARKLEPASTRTRLMWAYVLLGAGRAEDSYSVLEALHEDSPDFLPATLLLADAARATGRNALARERYAEILERQPDLVPAMWGAFSAALQERDYAMGEVLIERMRSALPEATLADLAAGDLARARGEPARAVGAYRAAHARAPSTRSALALAEALRDGGDLVAAQSVLFDWLSTNERDVAARTWLGTLEIKAGNQAEARKQFERVVELEPDDAVALNNLAWLYDEAGDPRAVELAERALARMPDSVEARDTLGWILVRKGVLQRGLTLLEQAHAERPADPMIAHHYAHALVLSGERGKARDLLARTLEQHPQFHDRAAAEDMLARLGKQS